MASSNFVKKEIQARKSCRKLHKLLRNDNIVVSHTYIISQHSSSAKNKNEIQKHDKNKEQIYDDEHILRQNDLTQFVMNVESVIKDCL